MNDDSFGDMLFMSFLNKKLEEKRRKESIERGELPKETVIKEQSDITHPMDLLSQPDFSFVSTNTDKNETNPFLVSVLELADKLNPFKIFR